ncbi:MAG: response regulator [Elusimicrobia bacterium]|nr:response regulator [Elusimicrobiota bacterium]
MQKKILIADDEQILVEILKARLERNYTVITANNGEEALKQISLEKPDLLILDLLMPKKTGYNVLSEIVTEGIYVEKVPKVIILSARGKEIDGGLGQRLGADAYFVKPFQLSELEAKIADLLKD